MSSRLREFLLQTVKWEGLPHRGLWQVAGVLPRSGRWRMKPSQIPRVTVRQREAVGIVGFQDRKDAPVRAGRLLRTAFIAVERGFLPTVPGFVPASSDDNLGIAPVRFIDKLLAKRSLPAWPKTGRLRVRRPGFAGTAWRTRALVQEKHERSELSCPRMPVVFDCLPEGRLLILFHESHRLETGPSDEVYEIPKDERDSGVVQRIAELPRKVQQQLRHEPCWRVACLTAFICVALSHAS